MNSQHFDTFIRMGVPHSDCAVPRPGQNLMPVDDDDDDD